MNPIEQLDIPRSQAETELSALNAIIWAISESLEEMDVLRNTLERTLQALPAEAGEIYFLDAGSGELRWVLHAGDEPEAFAEKRTFEVGDGLIGETAALREPRFFDLLSAAHLRRPKIRAAGFRRLAATPLLAKGNLWGVMALATRHPDRLQEDRAPFLAAVGRQVGLAVAVARAYTAERNLSGRLEAVNRAAETITSARTVEETLTGIVEQARKITGARYGAVGVHTPDGLLKRFIYSGLSAEEAARIGDPPRGRGLLGMLRDEAVIRLEDLIQDSRFRGLPPHHPEMHSFLGVAVSSGDRTIGRIYLTEKEGGAPFSDQDEASVVALARHAAVAITNANLYEDLSRQARYLAAVAEVGKRVTGSLDFAAVMSAVVEGAASAMGADASFVFIRDEETPVLRCAAATGFKHGGPKDTIIGQRDGVIGRVTDTGMPLFVADFDQDPAVLRRIIGTESLRSMLLAPIRSATRSHGVLGVAYNSTDPPSVSAQEAIYGLADLAAIAIENSRVYAQARRLAVLEDRERIAMDLHDTTLQEIFAARLRLELAIDRVDEAPSEAREILHGLMDRLEQVNRSIRSYISTLSISAAEERYRLDQVLTTAVRQIDGSLDTSTALDIAPGDYPETEPAVVEQIILILREAIANAHMHGQASHVEVRLEREDHELLLWVEDNGRGFDPRTAQRPGHFGLHNMYERAARVGGSLQIISGQGEGTRVELRLPL